MKRFLELDTDKIKDHLIILDIDGTIIADGEESVDGAALKKINELKTNNEIYIYSNKGQDRNKKISAQTAIPYINSLYKKPSKKILKSLNNNKNLPILVIGDKFLTDGLFAKNIKTEFVKVKRVESSNDGIYARVLCAVDDFIYNFMQYLFLLRPLHWIKNLLIFVPIFFAKEFFIGDKFLHAFCAFLSFCLMASSVYIFNDIIDREGDGLHPRKKKRPLANGTIAIKNAVFAMLGLMIVSLLIAYLFVPKIILVIMGYFVLNLIYSFYLKKIAIFDILTVSSFYLLRIEAGGLATATPISRWLILCLVFASLLIIIGKRKTEFYHFEKRKVLHNYNVTLLDVMFNISVALTLMSYGLYSVLGVSSSLAVYSIFFVLIGIFRYLFIVHESKQEAEFPEKIIFSDKIILGSIVGWLIFMFFVFYL